jgi:hypothetical protein
MTDAGLRMLRTMTALRHLSAPTFLVAALAFFVTVDHTKGAASGTIALQSTPISKAGSQTPASGTATSTPQPAIRPPNVSATAKSSVAPAPGSSTQPVSPAITATNSPPPTTQPPGISPATQSAVQVGTTASTSANPTDKQRYNAYMASAKAFANAHEKTKAIEWYEKAVLVAPDDHAREWAGEELNQVSSWQDNDWVSPSLKQIQVAWFWLCMIVLSLCLLGCLRRLYRWIRKLRAGEHYYVLISPASNEFSSYFRDLVRLAHHDFEEQIEFARRIGKSSAKTVVPTFRSTSLIAGYSFSLPAEVSSKWWSPYATQIVNLIDPPQYTVDLGVMRLDKIYGLSVRLCSQHNVVDHWHESCADADVPKTSAELAYRVVVRIIDHSSMR